MESTLEKLKERIVLFDHTFEYSDDNSVWRANFLIQEGILKDTVNLSLVDKERLLAACKAKYNSWHSSNDFDNGKDQVVQNKIRLLCGFSFKTCHTFEDLSEEYMERFIEKTFDRMTEYAHLHLFDGPIEDHPQFEWVYESAKANFEDKYGEIGFIEDGRQNV